MKVPHLRNVAFTWDPQPFQPVKEWRDIARIETYHRCGYIGLFKPSIEEVLAQVPEHLLKEANAFVTLKGDTVACYSQGDGHRTITILYTAVPVDEEQNPYFDSSLAYHKFMTERPRV